MSDLQVTLDRANTEIGKLKDAMEKSTATTAKQTKGFNSLATAAKGFIALIAFDKIKNFLAETLSLAQARLEVEIALAQQLRISQNATDAQIQSLNEQAKALEKVGVVDADTITALQSRLSGFDLSIESIKALTPAILDYTVAEKGANVTRSDAESRANSLAQAINGNFKSLTSVGFVLDDATKKLISNGTEAERVAAIVKVLESTYQDVNETLGKSFVGQLKHGQQALEDFKTNIGIALLPALGVLSDELIGATGNFNDNAEAVNHLGKVFYVTAQGIIVVLKGLANGFRLIYGGIQTFVLGIAEKIQSVLELASKAADVLGIDSEKLGKSLSFTNDFVSDLKDRMGKNLDAMESNAGDLSEAFSQMLDPTKFKEATADDIAALDAQRKAQNALGESAEDTEDKLKKFTEGIAAAGTQSLKTRQQIQQDLTKSVNDFGSSLTDTFEETGAGLAKITVDAKAKLKELKDTLKETTDSEQRTDLQSQIKDQQAILKSSAGFAKRQADEIDGIRKKLTDAGIDLTNSGLDAILKAGDFQAQIKEEQRKANLNEFQLFEEQQNKKLSDLTDAFVTEITLLKQKYDTQKLLETDITTFLAGEDAKRLDATEAWAEATIAKYKEVADSIKNLIPDSTLLSNFAGVGNISPFSPSAVGSTTPATTNSTTNSTTTNISAPVTINGNSPDGMSAKELSATLGFELGKFTR